MIKGCFFFLLTLMFVSVSSLLAGYYVYLQLGRSETLVMPALLGLSEQEAVEKIHDSGLKLSRIQKRIDRNVPDGTVVEQRPRQLTEVKLGRSVVIVLAEAPQEAAVPDLRGADERGVAFRLADQRLGVGETVRIYHPVVQLEHIIATNPPAGAPVHADTPVDLLVSRGPRPVAYVMPDLVSMSEEEARRIFRNLPIAIRTLYRTVESRGLSGRVIQQQPLPGRKLSTQEGVELTLGSF